MKTAPRRELRIFWIYAVLTVVLSAIVYFKLPHTREIEGLWILLFKLTPYFAALTVIAYMPVEWWVRHKLERLLILGLFIVTFCFFVPKLFFHSDDFPVMYSYMLAMTPFLMLSFMLCYRLGGGSREMIFRMGAAMMLIMLSGLEDLAFVAINEHTDPRWHPIPEVWDSPHIEVFFGRPPTKYEVYAFIVVHVGLALFALFFPFKRLRPAKPST